MSPLLGFPAHTSPAGYEAPTFMAWPAPAAKTMNVGVC